MTGSDDVRLRFLRPDEAGVVTDAIHAAYGDTYDDPWVFDPAEVRRRLAEGRLVSCVAEDAEGGLLCHAGLSRHDHRDEVAHAGQAVTLPAARGHHLFTRVKHHLADWAAGRGMVGIYSEATAAHPYSQRANVELGAAETGFLLGWIPSSVTNDAAAGPVRRQSAALFFLRLNHGHTRPVYVPERHRAVTEAIIAACGLRGRVAEPARHLRLPDRSRLRSRVHPDHNSAILTAHEPGADLDAAVAIVRQRLFSRGIDVLYLDLPLDHPGTALAADHLERLGVSFCGVFPNTHADGDVLRMQSLNGISVTAQDVAVASDHGRDLLSYVLADLEATDADRG